MFKLRFQMLIIMFIGLVAGCAGPLQMVPTVHTSLPPNLVVENTGNEIIDQFRLNQPRYSVAMPQKMVLYKGLYQPEKSRLYIWLLEGKEYELVAIDLASRKILWGNQLPKNTTVYGMGKTVTDDLYLDLNYYGSALVFVDPDQGLEKWRHGKDAKEGYTGYCKYFNQKFNFFLTTDSIIVQDPSSYQTINSIKRFPIDQDRNGGQGYKTFYNIHVYEINDQLVIMDNGMHAVSKETGQTLWSTRFPTLASRYHTGKNVALAIVGAMVGVYGGGRGPDYVFPSPLVIQSDGSYFVSALSNLYRIDSSTGHVDWAYDLGIGFSSRIDTSEDRVYLAACGAYESGIFCFDQGNGAQASFQTPFTRPLELEPLAREKLEAITENEMWERNLTCYDAFIGKKGIVPNEQYLYSSVIPIEDEIVALSNDAINAFDKQDGRVRRSLPNPSFGCNKFERLMPFHENTFLAISKNEIAAINMDDFTLIWKFDTGWTIDNIDKFQIDSISDGLLYVHAIIDKKIKVYILKKENGEMIRTLEVDESLRGSGYLAILNDNKISIFH